MTDSPAFRTPLQDRSRQSFERVLEATIELLAEGGFDGLTLAAVSQRAGVSTGSIYGRVRGKEELLDAAQTRILEKIEAEQAELLSSIRAAHLTFEALVLELVSALGEFLRAQAHLLRPVMSRAPFNPDVGVLGKTSFHKLEAGWSALVLEEKDRIGHPRPEQAALACFNLAYAAFARYLALGSSAEAAGQGDWEELKLDLGEMCLLFLVYRRSD